MTRTANTNNPTTCYVIASDIPNDKTRRNIPKLLLGYGKWTQYSLFECFLNKRELRLLQSKLEQHLNVNEESVRFYPLCANCVRKGETIGGPPPAEDLLCVV